MKKSIKKNSGNHEIIVIKDKPGFLAKVKGQEGIIAWGETEIEALQEMDYVLGSLIDMELESIESKRKLRHSIKIKMKSDALQV
jgi:predicted RNase H-like HicB family nuclease